nr:response regulator [uncultured Sulfurimonas sp.]
MNISKELKVFAKDLTLLIVEDDKELNNELVEISNLFFKDVKFAYDGKEGLEVYKQKHFDIVLSDITMPHVNGIELSKQIKNINSNQNIIILSAHSEISHLINLIDIGIKQFVHKPFSDEEFLYRLLKVCEKIVLSKDIQEDKKDKEVPVKKEIKVVETEEKVVETKVQTMTNHIPLDVNDFFASLQNDTVAWGAIAGDINLLLELNEDFESYISLIYTNKLNNNALYSISSILKKMYTILTQIAAMSSMTNVLFNLANFVEEVDYSQLNDEQKNKFKILEFIYDDISRFIETVFVYKDAIDIHYLEDSLNSSIEQLKQSIYNLPFEEEELELF